MADCWGAPPNRFMLISMRTAPTANDVCCRQSPTPDSSGCDESTAEPPTALVHTARSVTRRPSHLTTPRLPARTAHHAVERDARAWAIGGHGPLYVRKRQIPPTASSPRGRSKQLII